MTPPHLIADPLGIKETQAVSFGDFTLSTLEEVENIII